MKLQSSAASDTGRRKNNEDRFYCSDSLGLFVVADGMGGYDGGEIASSLAVDAIERFVENNRRDPDGTWPVRPDPQLKFEENLLCAGIALGDREIRARQADLLRRMGTTVVAALVHQSQLTLAHVGDSRAYLLRNGLLRQLTRDHSVYAELVEAGVALGGRAEFQYKNQITRALGTDDARAELYSEPLVVGDTVLLCSDGVYDLLSHTALKDALRLPPQEACRALLERAYQAGSADNLTAVVLRVVD